MPRPNPPPTPGSSSELRGKEGAPPAPAFNLPPNAYQEADRASSSSATPSANGSDSSYRPVSPASPEVYARKRPATHSGGPVITKDDFTLPPPPTRSRKIIQMKPRESEQEAQLQTPTAATGPQVQRTQTTGQSGGKRKQNTANTTAAGRKIARKTAHSLIERRRRSKMNEEFGVLKDMIPACKGQEMHKLAILQASIDYLRYLEQCVTDLKAQNNSPRPQLPPTSRHTAQDQDEDEEDDEDEEMEDENEGETAISTPATAPQDRSGSIISLPSLSQITTATTTSPSAFSTGAGRHFSVSSASQASYSPYFHSTQTSPAFGPHLSHLSAGPPPLSSGPHSSTRETFGLGSPALKPLDSNHHHLRQIAEGASSELADKNHQRRRSQHLKPASGRSEHELDQEATAALLMLNTDRRNWRDAEGQRSTTGMSVRDLLSG